MPKRCSRCHESKDPSDFYKNRSTKDLLDDHCKVCRKAVLKQYRETTKGKTVRRKTQQEYYYKNRTRILAECRERYVRYGRSRWLLEKRYGIDQRTYDRMSASQGGKCAICGKLSQYKLVVDHDHTTNKIRGLLCRYCNIGIGHFMDDPKTLKSASAYLRKSMKT